MTSYFIGDIVIQKVTDNVYLEITTLATGPTVRELEALPDAIVGRVILGFDPRGSLGRFLGWTALASGSGRREASCEADGVAGLACS